MGMRPIALTCCGPTKVPQLCVLEYDMDAP